MKTLNEPLFEVNQESKFYKLNKQVKDNQAEANGIVKRIGNEFGFDSKEFAYYGANGFGFHYDTKGFHDFRDKLTKNPDRNGVYTFKMATKQFKAIKPYMVEVEKLMDLLNPFEVHDIFGMNNLRASQWIEDRLFFEVKDEKITLGKVKDSSRNYNPEPVKEMNYKDYLKLVLSVEC